MLLRRALTIATSLLWAGPSLAANVGLEVHVQGGPVDPSGVEAVVWHALALEHGLTAEVVSGEADRRRLAQEGVTSLLDVTVTWSPRVFALGDGRAAATPAPDIEVVEHVLRGGRFVATARWTSVGAAAVYRSVVPRERIVGGADPGTGPLMSLPEVALQEAVWAAMEPVAAPPWGRAASYHLLPVIVVGDEAYRATYGARWVDEATRRVGAASEILAQAGLRLRVVGAEDWSPPPKRGLDGLLDDLTRTRPGDAGTTLRIGFTRTGFDVATANVAEDVGRAVTPGRDVLVVDQAAPDGLGSVWDVAEESVVVAHEVLHALGVTHEEGDGTVMGPTRTTMVWRLSERTRALARAAAQARVAHWNPATALLQLADAAERWLTTDRRLQLAYVVENLPAVPSPGAVEPARMSALANAALGRRYLRMADEHRSDADLHRRFALVHARAALAMSPALADDLGAWLSDLDETVTATGAAGSE